MRHSDLIRALTYKSQSAWNVNIVISLTVLFTGMFKKLICMFIGQFGSLVWSASEKYLLYVAEKKLPKAVSYFEKQKGKVYMQLFWEKWTEKKGKSACKTHSTSRELHNLFIFFAWVMAYLKVACLVAKPLNRSEAMMTLLWYKRNCFSNVP